MNVDEQLASASEAMEAGDLDKAESDCRFVLALFPRHFHALIRLSDILTRAGRHGEALTVHNWAELATPGYTHQFTTTCTTRFRMTFGPAALPLETNQDRRRVQMRSLGQDGRFGNQLLQYAFVHMYASRHDFAAEFPDWIGRDIFDAADPFPREKFPTINENEVDLFGSLSGPTSSAFVECDIKGYFCGDTAPWAPWKTQFRKLLKPGKKVQPLLDKALNNLRLNGTTILAIHLRRGDYGHGRFWIAPSSWYVAWLKSIWANLDRPVLYIASDSAECHAEFAEFNALTADRLGVNIPGAEFLIDHHVLRHANFVAISNSTFSFTAAMLNEKAISFLRPEPNLRKLVNFDPWSTPVLLDPDVDFSAVTANEKTFIQSQIAPNAGVIYWGSFCSPWTNFVRAAFHRLKILEVEEKGSICNALRLRNVRHAHLLVLENNYVLEKFLGTASEIFNQARIDFLLFRVDTQTSSNLISKRFSDYNYDIYRLTEGSLERIVQHKSMSEGTYVALDQRSKVSTKNSLRRYDPRHILAGILRWISQK